MGLPEELKSHEKAALSEEKKGDLFFAMLKGKTVKDTVSTSKGNFVIRYPQQNDLIAIARMAAFMRGGIPAGQFDTTGEYEIQKCATLDITVESGPAWFDKIKKEPDFSWRDMPDAGFVDEVYAKALSFRQRVQAEFRGIKKSPDAGAVEKTPQDVPPDVGDGVFSGVASPTKRGRSKSSRNSV